ncbi:MAG: dipeptidase [Thermaceae bacterium]|nr:dipeptidase [Thermaceae bacterium]
MQEVLKHLEAHFQAYLAELAEFVRIPSVSTDPAYAAEVTKAAHWVAQRLRRSGVPEVEILETPGHPVVYGAWETDPRRPTLLIYGHYDVQPPDPLERWQTPPFAPAIREVSGEQRLYARGVSDDKGPMLIPLLVTEAFQAVKGAPPINLKFLLEGEEEVGSRHLEAVVQAQLQRLKADFVLSADGAMWRPGVSSLNLSARGLVSLEFSLIGPSKDLHSGRHGGAILNPLVAMARLIASLHEASGRVAVEGFYDRVCEASPGERAAIQALPWEDGAYLAEIGAQGVYGEPGYSTLERQWIRPTLEVNGLWGGYTGPGGKTVIPSRAQAKLSCRLVPEQNPDEVRERLIQHLHRHCPPSMRLEIQAEPHGARPYALPSDHVGLRVARAVLRETEGQKPLEVRMGGTLPIANTFKEYLGLDTVFFSFSTGDEDFHAPNEFFRLERFRLGLEAWARYWWRLAHLESLET